MHRSKSIHFFATAKDLENLLRAVEVKRPLKYVRAGMTEIPDVIVLPSGLEIPDLGTASTGDQSLERWWLVLESTVRVEVARIPQRRGGMRFTIDQSMNPSSVAFRPGGVFESSCIIAGQVGTATDNASANKLLNLFAHEIRRQFKRIKSYFVGPEAQELLNTGFRLTASVSAPEVYDLSLA